MVRKVPLSAPHTPTDDGSVESDAVRNVVLNLLRSAWRC